MKWLDGITDARDMNLSKLWEMMRNTDLVCCSPWGRKKSDATGRLNNNNWVFWQKTDHQMALNGWYRVCGSEAY